MSPSPRACIARLDIVDGCTSFQKKNHLQFSTANGSFFFYCTPCDWSASNLGFLRKYEKNWPLSWWLVNAVSFCTARGANLPVSRGTQALWRHGSGFACCTFMQVSARVRISALSRIRIEAQRSGQCGIDVSSITPIPIGAIRRLSRANLFGKCCVEGRARSSHISVLSSISVGLSRTLASSPVPRSKSGQ